MPAVHSQPARLLHELLAVAAARTPDAEALIAGGRRCRYEQLAWDTELWTARLAAAGVRPGDRVVVWLDKRVETVAALFATSALGGIAVPANPVLKAPQIAHLMADCAPRVLVTSRARMAALGEEGFVVPAGMAVLLVDELPAVEEKSGPLPWQGVETAPAMIFYTSGSTGRAKGVVVSHRNLVAGADAVASYLENRADDRLLGVLPLSFDYGFSQLTTAFLVGACVVLMDFLLPRDVLRQLAAERITGLAGVPSLWAQLARLEWPDAARRLRYITNSGGRMPRGVLEKLRTVLPETRIHLMYGLTEAFRSTTLPPDEVTHRPHSIGRAIPNTEIVVVDEKGRPVPPGTPGELVHRGPTVALGYWNDPERTAERFRTWPLATTFPETAERCVFSGDLVVADEEGYLTFLGRRDAMIKSGGYRISPEEVEEAAYGVAGVALAAAFGIPDELLGEVVVLLVEAGEGLADSERSGLCDRVRQAAHHHLPAYMQPRVIALAPFPLPRSPNGKVDRLAARTRWQQWQEAARRHKEGKA
ncbi:MAG: acyl-CoA ligase (AMP-forming), exosortase A system-associated [Alphaproteobacteria bacterium]|nr:MAG: acyl-CoA ligase (AMP-forming), exosortase A system-associated [Alphaproteobacteria bacterium]